jgi:hypothetical protein
VPAYCAIEPLISPHRQQFCPSIQLLPRCALQRWSRSAFQIRAVVGCARLSVGPGSCGRLLFRVPSVLLSLTLLVDVPNVAMAAKAIHSCAIDHFLVDQNLHLAARSTGGIQLVAATAGDVIMRCQVIFKRHPQERATFFPLFLSSDRLVRFIPEVFSPAIRLEHKQFHVLDWRRPTRLVGDVTLPATGAHSDRVYIMWPSLIRGTSPRHRMANRSAELVRARPDHRRVSNGNQGDAQPDERQPHKPGINQWRRFRAWSGMFLPTRELSTLDL